MLSWAIGTSLAALGGILIAPGIALDAAVALPPHRQRLRGGDLRAAAQPAADVPRRDRSSGCSEGYLSGYLPSRTSTSSGAAARRSRRSSSSSCCSCSRPSAARAHDPEPGVLPDAHAQAARSAFAAAVVAIGVVAATTVSDPDLITYGRVLSLGIVALSLVPLVGLAGQISLCQLSFAGIGAVVDGAHGRRRRSARARSGRSLITASSAA